MVKVVNIWDQPLEWEPLEREAQEFAKHIAEEMNWDQYSNGAQKHLFKKALRCSRMLVDSTDKIRQRTMDKEAEKANSTE